MPSPIVVGLALREDDSAPLALARLLAEHSGAPLALATACPREVPAPLPPPHYADALLDQTADDLEAVAKTLPEPRGDEDLRGLRPPSGRAARAGGGTPGGPRSSSAPRTAATPAAS